MTIIDAYCHVGQPRFGSAEDAELVAGQWEIAKSIFVLGPAVPDYGPLFAALDDYGNRVRGIGIPFGETPAQVMEVVDVQLRAGVMGLRVQPDEFWATPAMLDVLGERGRWLYAIGALASEDLIRAELAWLEKYPQAKIAAPHFLKPRPLFDGTLDDGLVRDLLSHPRFHAIFSRHGGTGSKEPYPHTDFLPWVEQVADVVGWERIMWGSEYPVLYWRDETMGTCRDWLSTLLPQLNPTTLVAFMGGNAQRLIFDVPAPERESVIIPMWVEEKFDRERTLPLFPGGMDVPMRLYQRLHHLYVGALQFDKALTFADFILQKLGDL